MAEQSRRRTAENPDVASGGVKEIVDQLKDLPPHGSRPGGAVDDHDVADARDVRRAAEGHHRTARQEIATPLARPIGVTAKTSAGQVRQLARRDQHAPGPKNVNISVDSFDTDAVVGGRQVANLYHVIPCCKAFPRSRPLDTHGHHLSRNVPRRWRRWRRRSCECRDRPEAVVEAVAARQLRNTRRRPRRPRRQPASTQRPPDSTPRRWRNRPPREPRPPQHEPRPRSSRTGRGSLPRPGASRSARRRSRTG